MGNATFAERGPCGTPRVYQRAPRTVSRRMKNRSETDMFDSYPALIADRSAFIIVAVKLSCSNGRLMFIHHQTIRDDSQARTLGDDLLN